MIVIGVLVGTCFLGKLLLPLETIGRKRCHSPRDAAIAGGNAALCVFAAAIVELLPAVAMGVLFPLFVDLTREQASRVGRAVGNIYAWNTFWIDRRAHQLTAIMLFPRIGTTGALGLAAAALSGGPAAGRSTAQHARSNADGRRADRGRCPGVWHFASA